MSVSFLSPTCPGMNANRKFLAGPYPSTRAHLVEHEDFIDLASEDLQDRADVHRGILDGRAYDFGFALVLKHQVHEHDRHGAELRQIAPKLLVIDLPRRERASLSVALGGGSCPPTHTHTRTHTREIVTGCKRAFRGAPRKLRSRRSAAGGSGWNSLAQSAQLRAMGA